MGIYIKDIDMPTNATGCEVIVRIQPDGTVLDEHGIQLYAKAVPVPSHGRLKDTDALLAQYVGNVWTAQTDYAEGLRDVINDIKSAPTIIEAEV